MCRHINKRNGCTVCFMGQTNYQGRGGDGGRGGEGKKE